MLRELWYLCSGSQAARTRLTQAAMGLWSVFFGFFAWTEWMEWTRDPDSSALFAIAPTVMAVLALAMMVIVATEARDNIAWLSAHIRGRLRG